MYFKPQINSRLPRAIKRNCRYYWFWTNFFVLCFYIVYQFEAQQILPHFSFQNTADIRYPQLLIFLEPLHLVPYGWRFLASVATVYFFIKLYILKIILYSSTLNVMWYSSLPGHYFADSFSRAVQEPHSRILRSLALIFI